MTIEVCQLGSVEIEVKVPDLHLLPGSADFVKVGGTCEHHGPSDNLSLPSECTSPDNNHWGTNNLISLVRQISQAYKAMPDIFGTVIRVNDMSLGDNGKGFGGRFDLGGQWGASPHHTVQFGHASGRAADIPFKVSPDIFPEIVGEYLIWYPLLSLGLSEIPTESAFEPMKYFDESNHYHVMK